MIGISSILSQPFTPLEFYFDEFFFFFLIVKGQAFFLWLFTDWKLYIWKILAINIVSDE